MFFLQPLSKDPIKMATWNENKQTHGLFTPGTKRPAVTMLSKYNFRCLHIFFIQMHTRIIIIIIEYNYNGFDLYPSSTVYYLLYHHNVISTMDLAMYFVRC